MSITIERILPGHFRAKVNGEWTQYMIVNGSLGLTGKGRNIYGIENLNTGKITWIGSLAAAKKLVTHWLKKTA